MGFRLTKFSQSFTILALKAPLILKTTRSVQPCPLRSGSTITGIGPWTCRDSQLAGHEWVLAPSSQYDPSISTTAFKTAIINLSTTLLNWTSLCLIRWPEVSHPWFYANSYHNWWVLIHIIQTISQAVRLTQLGHLIHSSTAQPTSIHQANQELDWLAPEGRALSRGMWIHQWRSFLAARIKVHCLEQSKRPLCWRLQSRPASWIGSFTHNRSHRMQQLGAWAASKPLEPTSRMPYRLHQPLHA